MNADSSDLSTAARLAKASERLSILSYELQIAVAEASRTGADLGMLSSVSARLSSQSLDLVEISLAAAEDVVAFSADPRAERSAAALGRVSRIIEPVFEAASQIAAHLAFCAEQAARMEEELTAAHLSSLDAAITEILAENHQLITGAGVATAPGALSDRELWMQWWVLGPSGPVQLAPQLDPEVAGLYDYPSAVWFRESARDLEPHLAPPHFDDGGTGTWMVTAAIPVVVRDALVGLACAELTLERVGALVAPALEAVPAPAALVSPEGLVVASTHPRMTPGSRALETRPPQHPLAAAPFAELEPGVTVARSPALAWRLVADWG